MATVTSLAAARAERERDPRKGGTPAGEPFEPEPVPTDDELARGVKNGDSRVAAHLYRRLETTVRAALRKLSGTSAADFEDSVQVAFERIVIGLKKGQFREGANLEAWAAVIASRAGIDHLRTYYRKKKVFSLAEPPEVAGHFVSSEKALELDQVRRALTSLKPSHAEVLFLHDAMGYSLAEIAAELDITVAAAQSRLVRTRKDLLSRLKKQERIN